MVSAEQHVEKIFDLYCGNECVDEDQTHKLYINDLYWTHYST